MTRRRLLRGALLRAVRFYSRAISPALPARCRFYPTCSAYAAEAIERHGAARGLWLTVRRLVKCAPWHPGGLDPVPGTGTAEGSRTSSTAVPVGSLSPTHRVHPATPPDLRRANEESSVA